MEWVPAPAIAGENVPAEALVIPVPAHVPPAVTAVKLTGASPMQNGPEGLIIAPQHSTIILDESDPQARV